MTGGVGQEPLYISEFLRGSQELCSLHECTAGCFNCLARGMVQWEWDGGAELVMLGWGSCCSTRVSELTDRGQPHGT